MEGLFNSGNDLSEKVATRLQSTFVGRTFSAIDRAITVTGDIGSRSLTSGTLNNRGYRVLGFNQLPEVELGLSLEMKEVHYCAYKETATPFLTEMRNITVRQKKGRQPGPGLVCGGGQRRIRIVVPEHIRSPAEVELYHANLANQTNILSPAQNDVPACNIGRGPPVRGYVVSHPTPVEDLEAGALRALPQPPRPTIDLAQPFVDYEANRQLPCGRECIVRQASLGATLCSKYCDRAGVKGKELGQSFYDNLPERETVKKSARRVAATGTYPLLGCVGAFDLTACDVTLSEWTIAKCSAIIDKQFGKAINPPSHYINQAMMAVTQAVAKSKDGRSSSQKESYLLLDSLDVEEQYQNSIKLLMCAMCLNKLQESTRSVTHWDFIDSEYEAKVKAEDSKGLSWFPPSSVQQTPAMERLEKSIDKLIELTGDSENVIPVLPARMMEGTPYEDMTVSQSDEQREELQKLILAREGDPPFKAMHCGPNLSGAPCAIDTGALETWMSGYSRHYTVLDRRIPLPDGTQLEIRLDKSHTKPKELTTAEMKCWCDMTVQHRALFKNWMQCVHTYSAMPDVKPNRMAQEVFEALKSEVLWDTDWGFKTLVRTAVFNKARELPATAMARARQISQPGCNGDDAKLHQAIASPIVTMIEKFHLQQFNFRNFKGSSFSGRGLRVARHISSTGEDTVTIGFDKAANDKTWSWAKWCKFETYCCMLAEVICECHFEANFPGMLPAGPGTAKEAEWRSMLLTVTADIIYFFLQSGINPTALANRMSGDCSVGAAILTGYGEKAYNKWLHWCGGADAIAPEDMQIEELYPFVADGIPVLENPSNGAMTHRNEGDDTVIEIICRILKGGKRETYSQAVSYFTKAICNTTKEAWEPAFISEEHLDRHGGRKSVVEVMSFVVECDVVEDILKFAQVPKPLKKLDKMAWTISQWFTIKDGPFGKLGVKNAVYHRESATRCFSMALELKHCMFVRWVVFNTGQHHLYKLREFTSKQNPDGFKPLYTVGTMEARELPDATGYIGDNLNKAHQLIGDKFRRTDVCSDIVLATNVAAWGFVQPDIVIKGNGKWIRETLIGLDETARQIEITEEHILSPVAYLGLFNLGALECAFGQAVARLQASEKSKWDLNSLSLEEASAALFASVKNSGSSAVYAQSQRRTAKPSPQRATGGAPEGSGNGQLDSAVTDSDEENGVSQGKNWVAKRPVFERSDHSFVPAWAPKPSVCPGQSSSSSSGAQGLNGSGAGLDFQPPPGASGPADSSSSQSSLSHRGAGAW